MKKTFLWLIPTALLLGLMGWRFASRGAAQAQMNRQQSQRRGAPAVDVAPATGRTIIKRLTSVGDVESPFKVEISPKTAGRIEYLQVREGDPVTPGETLVKIDPSDLLGAVLQQRANVAEARSRLAQAKITQGATDVGVNSQIRQQQAGLGSVQANLDQVTQNYNAQVAAAQAQVTAAESAVANAKASLEKEQASLRNTQSKYDRTYNLYKQGFVAAQDVDDAKTAVDVEVGAVAVAKGQVDAANSQLKVQRQNLLITKRKGLSDIAASKASVTQAQATLSVANANLSQMPAYKENLAALQSQVDAAVAQLNQAEAKLSDTVLKSSIKGTVTARKADPGGIATPGSPVLEVQFLDWLYVTATIPIEASTQVHDGQTVEVTLDALPGRTFTGVITNLNPAADPQSRQFGIRVRLDNKDRLLRPGMYAQVSIETSRVDAAVVVPREALRINSDGTTSVTVIDADKVAHVRTVKVGDSDEKGSQILEGVEPGDKVVVLAYAPVKDGQTVSVGAPATGGGGSRRTRGGGRGSKQ